MGPGPDPEHRIGLGRWFFLGPELGWGQEYYGS